jgi:hypothetical protein
MKSVFIILVTFFSGYPSGWEQSSIALAESAISNQVRTTMIGGDSPASIRIINTSALKQLPAVIRDLSAAFKGSSFQDGFLLGKNGFAVYLYDMNCNSFKNSAIVQYRPGDTIYHLGLNRFNQGAADNALAATMIHELMHCLLLDIYARAKKGEERALAGIVSFGLNRNDTSGFFNNDFFGLVNSGNEGQHELIYQLFYTQMVSLLERFAEIHNKTFLNHKDAASLMWSGLQETDAYRKLSEEEKRTIGLTILAAKGIEIEQD